jgi:hypothetical protein
MAIYSDSRLRGVHPGVAREWSEVYSMQLKIAVVNARRSDDLAAYSQRMFEKFTSV